MQIKIFIQARMSSSRFPGKMLAPVNGMPMVARVLESIERALGKDAIVLATSAEASDDPLALYVKSLGFNVFRGDLDNVFNRFCACLLANPCDWFFRISGDSPMMNAQLLKAMTAYIDEPLDMVTNVQRRTFPKGHSAELLKAETFLKIDPTRLSAEDCEHVTKFYYAHADEFKILNLENIDMDYAQLNFVVDTLDDLNRVESMRDTPHDFIPQMKVSHL